MKRLLEPASLHLLGAFGLMCLALLLLSLSPGRAAAQSCTGDFQCQGSLISMNQCIGDTLVMRRSLCVAGQCMTQETGRINCGSSVAGGGRCEGATWVRSVGRCDALSGRCAPSTQIRVACVRSCNCRGNVLSISTGRCSPGGGCGRARFRCKKGCTCEPEPRCLEDPPAARQPKSK